MLIYKIAKKSTIILVMSVRLPVCLPVCLTVRPPAWNKSAPTGPIFTKSDISIFFENLSRKSKLYSNLTRIRCALHEDQCTFLIISRSVIGMRNVSSKRCRGKQNTYFVFNNFFLTKSCLLWYNVEIYCRAEQATDDNIARAHCILGTNT